MSGISLARRRVGCQVRLLEKLLNDEIRSRARTSQTQAKVFSEEVQAVLHPTSSSSSPAPKSVERLVEIAKRLRDARRRHEQLGLSREEAAFYDALAGGVEDVKADPALAKIAHELVDSIRTDLAVDWADRAAAEAKIRAKIKGRFASTSTVRPHRLVVAAIKALTTPPSSSSTKQRHSTAAGRTLKSGTGCSCATRLSSISWLAASTFGATASLS